MTIHCEDEKWMQRCLQLAHQGIIGAAPNPMVGAVIVCNGSIIGEGYHARCGEGHAEVRAFASVKQPELLPLSTLYVSLEPCAHYGKTPPCARLIIEKGVKKVVIGMQDPFSKVNGMGIRMLLDAGIEVKVGIMQQACRELNRKFLTFHLKKRPYITLKWAQSSDGFMAPSHPTEQAVFLSTPHTLLHVHRLRAEHQAILVGRNTAETDNPRLNPRLFKSGRTPLRIILDREACLQPSLHIFDGSATTLIVGHQDNPCRKALGTYQFMQIQRGEDPIQALLHHLYEMQITSLLVEGGQQVLQAFIHAGHWDEAHVEIANTTFHGGLPAPELSSFSLLEEKPHFHHHLRHYLNASL